MQKGLNFKTLESQNTYFNVYEKSLQLIDIEYTQRYIDTSYGKSHILCCGKKENPPLVLLHAASCGSPIWYKNLSSWSKTYCIYAIDLIGEASKSILTKKMKTPYDNAKWLDETLTGLQLDTVYLCGLSIGAWNAANYAGYFSSRVLKLILLSPVQTFSKMHISYFYKIMRMGFHPTKENIEKYIGWGNKQEGALPDSIIEQFKISVMNINSNASFPKWLKKEHICKLKMPTLVMIGEREFAFSISKAIKRANSTISDLTLLIVKDASHLLVVSKPDFINEQVLQFLNTKKQ